ncbi:methyltransferase domain-containing protein [Frankia sp. CNm7]|uniref:Methyltransferase domain-containing protein n=1 Tax=Frankia nepalensis TaxID=1836974 RepID=A0A937RCN9_9ACTN|nr:methyltransferase [Frankia nepalensis]MBL7494764.1 methyltransferase domain-containing protein [Frankia nepalensis]MBL7514049.1 methyltransferase domain-containing protein [Frankia nepalensis]MBL7519560.1 methyltransferase domain-containing protein [Frankia nepalensis]MBL7626464.1 methyltransferase domain-containing protein [Frankia nepalensis]
MEAIERDSPRPAPAPPPGLIRSRAVARGYDVLNALLWLPGGSDRLRRRFVALLDIDPGMRVLELGCGTGLVTRHLLAAGARVTAVDGSTAMMAVARRRAPDALFTGVDLSGPDLDETLPTGDFDLAVLSFVLHELDPARRARLLRVVAERLGPDGQLGILDWGVPPSRPRAAAWRFAVRAIEPPVAHDVLDGALDAALATAGLVPTADHGLAGHRARALIATLAR